MSANKSAEKPGGDGLKRFPLYRLMLVLAHALLRPFLRVRRRNRHNIPQTGGFILTCNHVNMLDPVLLSVITKRHMRFMAKSELMTRPILGPVIRGVGGFPIQRGEADMSGIRIALTELKQGGGVLIFPEGTRNPNPNGALLPLHDGVALLALKAGVPVIPCYLRGRYNPVTGIVINVGERVDLSDMDARRADKETLAACTMRIRKAIHKAGGVIEE